MPTSNLSKIFGPTIVGYSNPDPEPEELLNETKQQAKVRTALRQILAQQHCHAATKCMYISATLESNCNNHWLYLQ
jgi:hypothetical protein